MISHFSSHPDAAAISLITGVKITDLSSIYKLDMGAYADGILNDAKTLIKMAKKKKKKLYLSCCQEHFQFPRCVFDESVLKSIDVASVEIKIV